MSPRTKSEAARKALLFCPTCGHQSPLGRDGDWRVEEGAGRRRYVCPACETVVVEQPRPEADREAVAH